MLQSYIEKQLGTREPAKISRALMVAGLSVPSKFRDEVLARYRNTAGFIGRTHTAAMYAYVRNMWAEHWFKQMHETTKTDDSGAIPSCLQRSLMAGSMFGRQLVGNAASRSGCSGRASRAG